MLEAVLRGSPWFWPGLVVALAISVAATPTVTRLLRINRVLGWLLIMSLAGVVLLTLTPSQDAGGVVRPFCDVRFVGPPSWAEMTSVTQASLNVALFVPLGLVIGLMPRWRLMLSVAAAAIVIPFAVETLQYLAPILGRSCQADDVAANLAGLVMGLTAGVMLSTIARSVRRVIE